MSLPRPDRRRSTHPLARGLAGVLATTLLLAGCMTGQRPTLGDAPTSKGTMTGDPNIDAVLTLFDQAGTATFTAVYTAVLTFDGTTSEATVTQEGGPQQRAVTIGSVRFITDASGNRTCVIDTGVCDPELKPAAVSNTGLTPEFAVGDMAKRLRRDAAAKIGDTTPSTTTFADRSATCVDVPVTNGTKQYCAFANGVLARFVGGDVTIDVVSISDAADPTQFTNTTA
jgi:hypothetical protein